MEPGTQTPGTSVLCPREKGWVALSNQRSPAVQDGERENHSESSSGGKESRYYSQHSRFSVHCHREKGREVYGDHEASEK